MIATLIVIIIILIIMSLLFVLITQIIRAIQLNTSEKTTPVTQNISLVQHTTPKSTSPVKPKLPIQDIKPSQKSIESLASQGSQSINRSIVIDRQNKKCIQSGSIVSLTCNGPAMFYLLTDNTIEVQPNDKKYTTNLENPTQIFAFQQKLYAIDNHKLFVASKQDSNSIKFVLVPAYMYLNDIEHICGREDLFALCRYNSEEPEINGIYTYQFDGKKTMFLEKLTGKKYFYAYDKDIYAILDNNDILTIYDDKGSKKYYDVKTMAFDKENEPIIINNDERKVREIESYFGNIYLLKDTY